MCKNVDIGMYVFPILADITPYLTYNTSLWIMAWEAPDINMEWYGQLLDIFAYTYQQYLS